jgi:outer membrane protein assembly factor BamB
MMQTNIKFLFKRIHKEPVSRAMSIRRLINRMILGVVFGLLVQNAQIRCVAVSPRKGDWPQWRGPGRDGVSLDTGLVKTWPTGGPPILWENSEMGKGQGQPSIANGYVFSIGYDFKGETVYALDENTGDVLWKTLIGAKVFSTAYGSCSTPTVDGDRVYALGSHGDLACLDASTGKVLWKKNLITDFGGKVGGNGYCESPLVDEDKVLATPNSASATVIALNKLDGSVIWQCPYSTVYDGEQTSSPLNAASIMPMTVGGQRFYVQGVNRVKGVSAKTGVALWSINKKLEYATVLCRDNQLLLRDCLVNLSKVNNAVEYQVNYDETQVNYEYGGVVLVDGFVYGTRNGTISCTEFATGKLIWSRPSNARPSIGRGSIAYADGRLYYRTDSGLVALFEATPTGPVQCGYFHDNAVLHYAPPSIANRRLYLRDGNFLTCYFLAPLLVPLTFQGYQWKDSAQFQLRIARSDGLPMVTNKAVRVELVTSTNLNSNISMWKLLTTKSILTNGVLIQKVTRNPSESTRYYSIRVTQ